MNLRLLRPVLATLTLSLTSLVATTASAQDPAACVASASKAQKLRNAHKLVEARAELRICAAGTCPAALQSDCVPWLAEVEKLLPGVVVGAKDDTGADLINVKVSVDGQPLLTKLDGQSIPIDAGAHTFHFEGPDGQTLDRDVVIREGDKGQTVAVVLPRPGGAKPGAGPGAAAAPESGSSTLRTVGWVVGGVGAAGVVVGLISGIVALSDKSSADCTNNVCNPGSLSGLKTTSAVSTAGWVAGGVLLAGGAGILLFGPKGNSAPTTGVRLMPVLSAGGGAMVAGGSF
jgi:hypothetical protein